MQYYVISATGTGTESDPIRPNISLSSWVGESYNGTFLVGTNDAVSGYTPLTTNELQTECINRSLNYNDVLEWLVP